MLANTLTIIAVGLVITGWVVGIGFARDDILVLVMKVLAITAGIAVLCVKTLGVIVHTENIKIINVRATAYEGCFESSLQLLFILSLWFGRITPDLDIPAMSSSLLVMAKSGAESFLTFGQDNKLRERNIMGKLKQIAKLILVFLLTAGFRVTTLSVTMAWDHCTFLFILLPAVIILPVLVLLLVKLCGKQQLQQLRVAEIVQGVVGEMTSIVLWGETGREGSREIQAVMGGYLTLLYSTILALVIALPSGIWRGPWYLYSPKPELLTVTLVCGLVGYGLFFYQLFLFGKYNWDWRKKIHNMGSGLVGH